MSTKILITDLRNPVHTPAQRAFLEEAERNPAELTESAVLAAARERADLDDFGPDDFRERLGVLLREGTENPNLTDFVKNGLFGRCVGAATNRLMIRDLLTRHPEIHEQRVERPIVIAGLPRSGTTHLLGLLSADPRLRSLPFWESVQPIPRADEPVGPDGVDPRYTRAVAAWERLQLVNPMMAPYHRMDPDHIHEDLELQVPDFSSYMWEWMLPMPRWRDYYLGHDQTPHYEYTRTVLKIMQWQDDRTRPWVLKCPQHFENLRAVMNVYPDALVVFTHRDPVASLQSIVTQLAYITRMREKRVDPDGYLIYWTDRVHGLLSAYVRDLDVVPPDQRFDVRFDEFMRDDLAIVDRILTAARMALDDESREPIVSYLANHQRHQYGAIDHDLRRDFGVDPAEIRERFAFYVDALDLPVEAR